jgi:hypothetical protein
MIAGTTYIFAANQPVTWTSDSGTFSQTTPGLFTAPDPPPSSGSLTITATSAADPATSKTTTVVIFPELALDVNPAATLPAGGSVNLNLAVKQGTGIPGESILFSCRPATLPTGVSCSFSQNPLINSGTPKVALTIASGPITQGPHLHDDPWKRFTLGGSSLVIAGALCWLRPRLWKHAYLAIVACSALLCSICLTACGTGGALSGPSHPSHVTGSHVINVDVQGATVGAADLNQLLATVPVTLTIQ